MFREHLISAGKVLKAHGVTGDLIIHFDLPADVPELSFIFPEIDGLPVPFRTIHKEQLDEDTWIFTLADIHDREQAREFTGTTVYLERKYVVSGDDQYGYAGYSFSDITSGKRGEIIRIADLSENPLFEVDCAGEKFLIPAHTDFVVSVDRLKKEMILKLPEGIFG